MVVIKNHPEFVKSIFDNLIKKNPLSPVNRATVDNTLPIPKKRHCG